jgi:hypothetical protein
LSVWEEDQKIYLSFITQGSLFVKKDVPAKDSQFGKHRRLSPFWAHPRRFAPGTGLSALTKTLRVFIPLLSLARAKNGVLPFCAFESGAFRAESRNRAGILPAGRVPGLRGSGRGTGMNTAGTASVKRRAEHRAAREMRGDPRLPGQPVFYSTKNGPKKYRQKEMEPPARQTIDSCSEAQVSEQPE